MNPWFEVAPIEMHDAVPRSAKFSIEQLPDSILKIIEEARRATSDMPLHSTPNWSFARRISSEEVSYLEHSGFLDSTPIESDWGRQYFIDIPYLNSWYRLALFVSK